MERRAFRVSGFLALLVLLGAVAAYVGYTVQWVGEEGVVELDEDRKAQMVSNLLVVLCGDRATQPVVNAGTLYG
jgi:hypothetical protein